MPKITAAVLEPTFGEFMASVPPLPPSYRAAADFDWAMHPGGATILTGAERALGLSPEHMRASYDTYMNHGNSSSATIFSVMDRLRHKDMDAYAPGARPKDYVVGCAFGPGIAVEMCLLKRNLGATGLQTPPETESEASRSEAGEEDNTTAAAAAPTTATTTAAAVAEKHRPRETHDVDAAFISEALQEVDLD